MISSDLWDLLPLTALYAETHYRFRFFPFSLYYRKQPEIVFDAPYRLDPGQSLPVALIIKDAHKFPVIVESVTFTFIKDGKSVSSVKLNLNQTITDPLWHSIFELDTDSLDPGDILLNAEAQVIVNGRRFTILNDNYPGLSHKPLAIYLASDPLPNLPNWSSGELHCHTTYGCDQVEFGAPLPVIQRFSRALGHSWAALTDHSYNLDDLPDNYLKRDPNLTLWQRLWDEVENLNLNPSGVTLIPGEELTCRNIDGRNVHLLILGNRDFLFGSGDGAEKWLRTTSEFTIQEALNQISPDSFTAASHPLTPTPPLEWLLVRRGKWTPSNLESPRLNGWQIANGDWGTGFQEGYTIWRNSLIQGKRHYIFGGNDAHGNFNRFRQVRLPMIRLREHFGNLFGKISTRINIPPGASQNEILKGLKEGRAVIGDGPALDLQFESANRLYGIGDEAAIQSDAYLHINWLSTPEFGKPIKMEIFSTQNGKEINILDKLSDISQANFEYSGKLRIPFAGRLFIRATLMTINQKNTEYFTYTNPIWLKNIE